MQHVDLFPVDLWGGTQNNHLKHFHLKTLWLPIGGAGRFPALGTRPPGTSGSAPSLTAGIRLYPGSGTGGEMGL